MLHSNQAKPKSQVSIPLSLKILLADDQKFIQQKLQQILSSEANLQVVGVASDGEQAIALVDSLKPDAVLIDIEMPKMNGIEAASIINRRFPKCKILVLSSHESPEYVQQSISAGADGYILKTTPPEDLVTAIQSVCKGYSYFDSQLLKKVQLADDAKDLSPTKPVKQAKIKSQTGSNLLPATKKKYRFGAKLLVGSGFLTALAVSGWFGYNYYLHQSKVAVPVKLVAVEKGTVKITLSESGKMELGGQQTLKSPRENATVEQVKVTEGEKVSVGETLLILRDRYAQEQEQEQEIKNRKLVLIQARNQEKVLGAQKNVQKKQAKVREAEELFGNLYISESELEEDRENLVTAQVELGDAQLELNSAELNTQNGQEKLASIQQRLQDRMVTSTIDGVVLDVRVKNGDGITTDTNLLTIGDPSQKVVKLQLTTLNASKVKLNQVARVSEIGPNPQTFTGRVIELSPRASTESEDSVSESNKTSDSQAKVNATILLDKPSNSLIPGSQVNVKIILEQRQNVVTLPIEMVQGKGNQPFVWVKNEKGKVEKQPVTLGLEDPTSVEITSGLQVGEQVILPSPDMTLTPGIPLQTNPD
jgi:HlyD family secretion protein